MEQRIAYLEFVNDQLLAEIEYVDQILRAVGFAEGLTTIKLAAKEVQEDNSFDDKTLG